MTSLYATAWPSARTQYVVRARKHARTQAAPVEVRQVAHPKIWHTAMELAGHDIRRIKVISPTEVEVDPVERVG
jgi:phage-related baseplate assembly protein